MIPRHILISTAILFSIALGMSLYVWQLRRREVVISAPVAEPQHVNPPEPGPTETITAWAADDASGTLHPRSVSIPLASGRQQRAEELMRGLLALYTVKNSSHPLPAGAEVHEVYLVDPGFAVVDLNSSLADGQTSGILAEELTIASMIETLSTNITGLTKVKFLVDGKERDTLAGHADLTGVYDVAAISDLTKQLSH